MVCEETAPAGWRPSGGGPECSASAGDTRITFIELPVLDGVLPLASGYMEAMCRKDPELAAVCRFTKLSLPVYTGFDTVLGAIEATAADVYAFSCYVWNTGLVRRLVAAILSRHPRACIVLGGPQVMHQGDAYIPAGCERVLVCNGEGERTFAGFLKVYLGPEPDFHTVRNLTFRRGDRLITTPPEPRITDLSEIPSPFLSGLFEAGRFTWTVIETNRGCPFTCAYCYWGGAIGARVHQYPQDRLEQELEWISRSGCLFLFIADANWGMLKRDVALSRHVAACQQRHGAPLSVYFCGSKNTPERVTEIAGIFHAAGMISSQSIALQTMSAETLRLVKRDNIKTSAYTQLQATLNTRGVSSYVEMIWPLPGETLTSFETGLAELCASGAESLVVYPLLLIHNVDLAHRRDELGLRTVRDPDPHSEAEIVVETATVSPADYADGLRFGYAVNSLHAYRGLWHLARYLHARGSLTYRQLVRAFLAYTQRQAGAPWSAFCERSVTGLASASFTNQGELPYLILHEGRDAFDELLAGFVRTLDAWADPVARLLFEVDLLNRPYIYRTAGPDEKRYRFEHLRVTRDLPRGYVAEVPPRLRESFREWVTPETAPQGRFAVDHRRGQLPWSRAKSRADHLAHCVDLSQRIRRLTPVWEPIDDPAAAAWPALTNAAAVCP